jgi:hypothetical protein
MAKNPPGESGGRRRINVDKGSPRTGDGKTSTGGKIRGSSIEYRTAGGAVQGTGSGLASRLRAIITGKGAHRSGK